MKNNILIEKVKAMQFLPHGWDTYNSPPPTEIAVNNTLKFLELLGELCLTPDWVEPTCDSIMGEVFVDGAIQEWEFYNDGDIAWLREVNGDPKNVTCGMVKNFQEVKYMLTKKND